MRGCDYLTPNWKEARALLDWPEAQATNEEILRTGRAIADRFGCGVVLTLGPRGITLFPRGGGEPVAAAAAAREVFDVSGAGDTVVAAFALATAAGASATESATFANRAAAVVVGKHGTSTVIARRDADERTGGTARRQPGRAPQRSPRRCARSASGSSR